MYPLPTLPALRVALADDDKLIRECVLEMLELLGAEVTEVARGDHLGVLLDGAAFDLVVSDVDMPGRRGVQVLHDRRVAADVTPFVVITGNPDAVAAAVAAESRAIVLAKPFSAAALRDAILRVLPDHGPH